MKDLFYYCEYGYKYSATEKDALEYLAESLKERDKREADMSGLSERIKAQASFILDQDKKIADLNEQLRVMRFKETHKEIT